MSQPLATNRYFNSVSTYRVGHHITLRVAWASMLFISLLVSFFLFFSSLTFFGNGRGARFPLGRAGLGIDDGIELAGG